MKRIDPINVLDKIDYLLFADVLVEHVLRSMQDLTLSTSIERLRHYDVRPSQRPLS